MGLLGRQLDLIRREPSFRWLYLATLTSGLGTGVAVIALTVDVFDRTGSGTWVAALLIADFLPMLVIGLTLGPLIDRFSRRRVMILADLARLLVFVALPFAPGPWAIVALAAVVGFGAGFFRPAVYAGMPSLVADEDLPHANSAFQVVENLTWMAGPLLGGLLLTGWGPTVPYLFNAATFLVSALLVARIPDERLRAVTGADEAPTGHWRELKEGFAVVRRSRALVTVLVAWTIVMLANANVNVAEVALAKVVFDAGDFGLGVLMATAGLGLVLGSAAAGALVDRLHVSRVYGGAILLMAVGIGAAAASPNVWAAAACVVVSGFGNGVATVCNPLLVQRGAPDRVRGRAFTVIMSVNFAFLGLGLAIAGPLTDALGARWVWALAAGLSTVAAVVGFALARGVRTVEPAPVAPAPVVGAAAPQAVRPEP